MSSIISNRIVGFLAIIGIFLHALISTSAHDNYSHHFLHLIDTNNNNNNTNNSKICAIPEESAFIMEKAIKYSETLSIFIRTDYLQRDAHNPYIMFLGQQCLCAVILNTYKPRSLSPLGKFGTGQSAASRFVVSEMKYFQVTALHYAQRSGKNFFIFHEPILGFLNRITNIFNLVWHSRKVAAIFVLSPEGIFFYDPLAETHHRRHYGKLFPYTGNRQLNTLVFSNMRGYPMKVQFFEAVFSTLKTHPTTGGVAEYGGVDGEALKLLRQLLNFTIVFNKPTAHLYGERLSNGSYIGAIGEIIKGQCDISTSGFFVRDYGTSLIDFTFPVYGDQLCIYTAKAQKVPFSILPIYILGATLKLFIIAGFSFCAIFAIFRHVNVRLYKLGSEKTMLQQYVLLFIDTWVVWVRRPLVHFPPHRSERIFLISISLLSVIFGVIFESGLATAYIEPFYFPDIQTLRDLDASGIKIFYKFRTFSDVFSSDNESQLLNSLNQKMMYVDNLETSLLNYTKLHPNTVSAISRYSGLHLSDIEDIIENRIWVVPECPQYYSIAYVVAKNSPFKKPIDFQLQYIFSAGFFVYWENQMYSKALAQLAYVKSKHDVPIDERLDLDDVQLSLYIIIAGLSLSVLVFCAELLIKRY